MCENAYVDPRALPTCDYFLSIVGMPQAVPPRITRAGCLARRCRADAAAELWRIRDPGIRGSVAKAQGCHRNLSLGAPSEKKTGEFLQIFNGSRSSSVTVHQPKAVTPKSLACLLPLR